MKRFILMIAVAVFSSANLYAEKIHIVMSSFPGYVNLEGEEIKGPLIEIMEATMKRANYSYDVKLYPWARAYKNITEGAANTLMPHLIRNEKRESRVQWVDEIMPMEFWMIKKKGREDIQIKTLDEARMYNFISVREDVTTQYLKERGFERIQVVNQELQPAKMLLADRGDLIIQDRVAFFQILSTLKISADQYDFVYKLEDMPTALWIALSNSTEDAVVKDIQKAFKQVKADGTYKKIMGQWGMR